MGNGCDGGGWRRWGRGGSKEFTGPKLYLNCQRIHGGGGGMGKSSDLLFLLEVHQVIVSEQTVNQSATVLDGHPLPLVDEALSGAP